MTSTEISPATTGDRKVFKTRRKIKRPVDLVAFHEETMRRFPNIMAALSDHQTGVSPVDTE